MRDQEILSKTVVCYQQMVRIPADSFGKLSMVIFFFLVFLFLKTLLSPSFFNWMFVIIISIFF